MVVDEIWAVVPVKAFTQAKTRLSGVFSDQARVLLARALFEDTLDILMGVRELGGVLIATDDGVVREVAHRFGANVLDAVGSGNINAAVALAAHRLALDGRRGMLVVPADLPRISASDIRVALSILDTYPFIIQRAEQDGGTNLLGLCPPSLIRPSFGENSFDRHLGEAYRIGITPYICSLNGIGLDIDRPDDLIRLGDEGGPRLRSLLAQIRPHASIAPMD